MSVPDKLLVVDIIRKMPVVIALTVPFGLAFGLMAGGVLVSPWNPRGQPAVVEPA